MDGPKAGYGGVAVYRRNDFDAIVHLDSSEAAERQWFTLHTNIGPLLLGNWYRPPDADIDTINALFKEFQTFADSHYGTILCGDFNIHHKDWLKFSNRNSPEGRLLHLFCLENQLKEIVRRPTRGDYLLDLCLSSFGSEVKASVLPKIADHAVIQVLINIASPKIMDVSREVWQFDKADWKNMKLHLKNISWQEIFDNDIDKGASIFTKELSDIATNFIPRKIIRENKSCHPWIDEDCVRAVMKKNAAEGTVDAALAKAECNLKLSESFRAYVEKTKEELKKLTPKSKLWWKKNRELLMKKIEGFFDSTSSDRG